jgi:hypothetical protein
VLPKWLQPWERFWFAPADPSLLALIRFSCGLIIVYTFAVYSLSLQDFMGQYGWHDLELRDQIRHRRPVNTGIPWAPVGVLPEPKDQHEQNELNAYFARYQLDLRVNGLPIPQNDFQKEYLYRYTDDWKVPPPAYPKDEEERAAINAYMEEFKTDPRRLYDIGTPVWSVWFHITDPDAMAIVHDRLRHAPHDGADLVLLSVLHPSQSDEPVRRRHDDHDLAHVPDDQSVRRRVLRGRRVAALVGAQQGGHRARMAALVEATRRRPDCARASPGAAAERGGQRRDSPHTDSRVHHLPDGRALEVAGPDLVERHRAVAHAGQL